MAQVQRNPAALPGNFVIVDNNCQLDDITKQKVPIPNVQNTSVIQELDSLGVSQDTWSRNTPSSLELVENGNIQMCLPSTTSTNLAYVKSISNQPEHVLAPVSISNQPLHASHPSNHSVAPQGGLDPSQNVSLAFHTTHGVFPPLQTTPYYFNAGDHAQQTRPAFFNPGILGCSPTPMAAHHSAHGPSSFAPSDSLVSLSSHASHGVSPPQQTTTCYYNAGDHAILGSNQPHAVSIRGHVLDPRTSTPSDPNHPSKAPYFITSQQRCPPIPSNVSQGAHGTSLHADSALSAPHAVLPPQQTASYYFNPDSLRCFPQQVPHGSDTPFLAGAHPQPSKTPLFNHSSPGGPPLPSAVQQGWMGPWLFDSSSANALLGMSNPYYYNSDYIWRPPHAHPFPIPRPQSPRANLIPLHVPQMQNGHDVHLASLQTHVHDPSNITVPNVSGSLPPLPDQPLTQTVHSNISVSKEKDPTPLLPACPFALSGSPNTGGSVSIEADSLNTNLASKEIIPSPLHSAEPVTQSQQGGPGSQPLNHPPSYSHIVCPPSHSPEVITPSKKGDYLVVSVDDKLYRTQVEKCKQSYIGKISYTIGDKPHPIQNLKNRLKSLWKTKGEPRLVPLGKGYFNISFESLEDKNLAGARSRWALSPGAVRLSTWAPGFNPYKLSSSNAQVWLRIYELPFEFWHSSVILGIAKAVGTPIKIDERSLDGSVGHYVRVLVEVDLSSPIHMEVMVDGPEYCDLVHLQFENLPLFCPICNLVGHSVTNCFRLKRQDEAPVVQSKDIAKAATVNETSKSPQRGKGRGRRRSRSRLVYRAVDKSSDKQTSKDLPQPSIIAEVGTSNPFAALSDLDSFLEEDIIADSVILPEVHAKDLDLACNPSSRSKEVLTSSNVESIDCSSAMVSLSQIAPKSILKKPRREVPGSRLEQLKNLSVLEKKRGTCSQNR